MNTTHLNFTAVQAHGAELRERADDYRRARRERAADAGTAGARRRLGRLIARLRPA
jgi:hypothetical protein